MYAHFTYADIRRITKVLNIMKALAESDDFFSIAVAEFEAATGTEKINMCNQLLEIFNHTKDCDFMTLEQAVILSAYPA